MKEKIILFWSGGKDSTMMLHEILESNQFEIVSLVTTLTDAYDRISMHGVRRELLEQQAQSLGLPLSKMFITHKANNEEYEQKWHEILSVFGEQGVKKVGFGDIFLEDLKHYRDKFIQERGFEGVYPLWKKETRSLVGEFIRLGYKARVTCVDTKKLDSSFSGRLMDDSFVQDLPSEVDPCGENGEFHSFVSAGPIFKNDVECFPGEQVQRDHFCFTDLVPKLGEKVHV